MQIRNAALVAASALTACILQGCGGGGGGSPTPAPAPPSPGPPPPAGWRTHPVEVRGQHLYDSITGEPFRAVGLGFPNVQGGDVTEWINVLHRIHELSPKVNVIRLYQPPCAMDGATDCIEEFMWAADQLGIYVLVPGTGTVWGWLPGPGSCEPATSEGCYKTGGVLGWGQNIVRFFNYPNTLAIVIGNEFDQQQPQFMPVLKAYARDLKKHMQMCNTDDNSPSRGQLRQIPLLYASSDDRGNAGVQPKMDYLFCGDESESIDIFGLNIERWCNYEGGKGEYEKVHKFVNDAAYPGAFMLTEMGCSKMGFPNQARDWAQLPGFFQNYSAFNGFVAYTYHGNPDFDMFSGPKSDATLLEDGKNFFGQTENLGTLPSWKDVDGVRPTCASTLLGHPLESVDSVPRYDTGKAGWAPQCPKPPSPHKSRQQSSDSLVVV